MNKVNSIEQFEEVVNESLEGVSIKAEETWFFTDEENVDKGFAVTEDDGGLHVSFNQFRVCFWIGQDVSKSAFNREAKKILKALGIPKSFEHFALI